MSHHQIPHQLQMTENNRLTTRQPVIALILDHRLPSSSTVSPYTVSFSTCLSVPIIAPCAMRQLSLSAMCAVRSNRVSRQVACRHPHAHPKHIRKRRTQTTLMRHASAFILWDTLHHMRLRHHNTTHILKRNQRTQHTHPPNGTNTPTQRQAQGCTVLHISEQLGLQCIHAFIFVYFEASPDTLLQVHIATALSGRVNYYIRPKTHTRPDL